MKIKLQAITLLLACLIPFVTYANDSEASVGAGGLELIENRDISIESENLYVSESLIKVNYLFKNNTNKEIETVVAFSLAPLIYDELEPVSINPNSSNPADFYVEVEGVPIKFNIERKNIERDTVLIKYYWLQKFPARKVIKTFHRYSPGVGGWFLAEPQSNGSGSKYVEEFNHKYCIDSETEEWIKEMWKKRGNNNDGLVSIREINYILKTANNWKGPIKRFSLTIDIPSDDDQMISFCFPGKVKTISKNRYQFKKSNYRPESDLEIAIIR